MSATFHRQQRARYFRETTPYYGKRAWPVFLFGLGANLVSLVGYTTYSFDSSESYISAISQSVGENVDQTLHPRAKP